MSVHIELTAAGVVIRVKVVPGASRDQIVGLLGEALKVKTAAPPEGGKANAAVCRIIAEALGVSERDVSVVAGHSQANKKIEVRGVTVEQVRERLSVQ